MTFYRNEHEEIMVLTKAYGIMVAFTGSWNNLAEWP